MSHSRPGKRCADLVPHSVDSSRSAFCVRAMRRFCSVRTRPRTVVSPRLVDFVASSKNMVRYSYLIQYDVISGRMASLDHHRRLLARLHLSCSLMLMVLRRSFTASLCLLGVLRKDNAIPWPPHFLLLDARSLRCLLPLLQAYASRIRLRIISVHVNICMYRSFIVSHQFSAHCQ